MDKYTQRPWYVHETPTQIGVRSNVLTVYNIQKSRKDFPRQIANAHLISATPELLAALRMAIVRNSNETIMSKNELLICNNVIDKALKNHILADEKKEPTPRNVDPCLLRGRTIIDSITQAENRLCDIERRLAVIETQPAPPIREWVGLTNDEIDNLNLSNKIKIKQLILLIETKLKEKNLCR